MFHSNAVERVPACTCVRGSPGLPLTQYTHASACLSSAQQTFEGREASHRSTLRQPPMSLFPLPPSFVSVAQDTLMEHLLCAGSGVVEGSSYPAE